jgi:hypothetical protein
MWRTKLTIWQVEPTGPGNRTTGRLASLAKQNIPTINFCTKYFLDLNVDPVFKGYDNATEHYQNGVLKIF